MSVLSWDVLSFYHGLPFSGHKVGIVVSYLKSVQFSYRIVDARVADAQRDVSRQDLASHSPLATETPEETQDHGTATTQQVGNAAKTHALSFDAIDEPLVRVEESP